jgi:hypothetical protein
MTLFHLDRAGFLSRGVSFSLVRVPDRAPEYLSPQPDDTVASRSPRLEWVAYDAGFEHTYTVEVWHVPAGDPDRAVRVYQRAGISSDSTGHNVEAELTDQPLFLYWMVSAVDEFGDRAVSLESKFWVRAE